MPEILILSIVNILMTVGIAFSYERRLRSSKKQVEELALVLLAIRSSLYPEDYPAARQWIWETKELAGKHYNLFREKQ